MTPAAKERRAALINLLMNAEVAPADLVDEIETLYGKRNSDPREIPGDIAGPGGPFDRDGVVIDATNAVLLDTVDVAAVLRELGRVQSAEAAVALRLGGRINKTQDRASVVFLFDADGAVAIISELGGLANRIIGQEFQVQLIARLDKLNQLAP